MTAGTMFEGTRKPLRTWFLAMWFVTSQKNGVSALGLQRALGLGSYETSWAWLHKLRRAMVRPGRDRLAGEIEADETDVGGPEEGKRGRQVESKAIVAVAAEQRGRGIGRIRLRRVKDVSAESLLAFLQDAVEPGATIHTDGWRGYAGLPAAGYRHQVTVIGGGSEPAHEIMPRAHKVAALLKRWLLGTLHGGIQHQHLDYYLDEFTFRFNRRRSQARGLLFHRLVQQAVAIGPAPSTPSSIPAFPPISPNWGNERDTHFAPYNAQVAALAARLPGASVGTVDKFQGQEAPVVIFSLATSTPEDAPRGMDFLYSPNRLNVAVSRARTACILVGSPKLFEPECRSPAQMRLANGFCRLLELAKRA